MHAAARTLIKIATGLLLAAPVAGLAATPMVAEAKSRVVVISDIGNEPDDSESFVRFLLYSNEFDVEGIVASTSVHQPDKVQPDLFRERIAAYGKVLPNLRRHAPGYPEAAELQALVRSGSPHYGMSGVGAGKATDASRLLIAAVDRADERPLWVLVWGGAADLAQALLTVRDERTPAELARFVSKLRVYSISDQDDAGPWARRNFPQLFWIASVHGWNQYGMAAWTGISGDLMRPNDKWPSFEMVTNEWLEANIRKGPLGSLYPPHKFIMEGDTPSLLLVIPNGLNDPERPAYGGWGGRYLKSDLAAGHFGDSVDTYAAPDGHVYSSNQATIFRWRDAFQRDFAARMQWSLTPDFKKANHQPAVTLNGVGGNAPVMIAAKPGERVRLTASARDPDGNALTYRWWQYREPTGGFVQPSIAIEGNGTGAASFVAPPVNQAVALHVIVEVSDNGAPGLTRYRRAIVTVKP